MITKRVTRRRGFTIVELLVAMALIILIMAVLSEAFTAGLSAFRSLKGLGDMQERLRVASTVLKRDLMARHFETDRKLSDFGAYWVDPNIGVGDQTTLAVGGRPAQGFFRIQTPVPPTLEGVDGDNIPSYIVTPDPNAANSYVNNLPVLHFASKLVPERKDALRLNQLFSTPVPAGLLDVNEGPPDFRSAGIMNSTWAEIAYFLRPNGNTAGTTTLYTLYRRQRLMVAPRRDQVYVGVAPAALGLYYGVSCESDPANYPNPPTQLLFNTEYSVAGQPYVGQAVQRSMMYQPAPGGVPAPLQAANQWMSAPAPVGLTNNEDPTLQTDDVVVSDVVSFEIKVLRPGDTDFRDLNDPLFAGAYTDPITGQPGTYDTATTTQGALQLSAVKITIRVWDFKTQQARQVSIVQDL
jgi:prepilin-type N-terminal cleavage/methylation domain-containing protein